MIYAGIDAGSRLIKAVLYDSDDSKILRHSVVDQGIDQGSLASSLMENLLREANLDRHAVKRIVATGYGRNLVRFADLTVTEITCHARGVRHLLPNTRTIVEVGGQDSKTIKLTERGIVQDFSMNDRCAAGTGRFLEVVAGCLGVALSDLAGAASRSKEPASISSMCVVFAETEIIGLLAGGTLPEDLIAGVQLSIARRVASMLGRSFQSPVVFTGGVAALASMVLALESALGCQVRVPPDPFLTGALGAALIASEQ